MKTVLFLKRTQKSVVQGKRAVGEHAFKSDEVEDLVDCVLSSNDANVPETQRATSDVSEQQNQTTLIQSRGDLTFFFQRTDRG